MPGDPPADVFEYAILRVVPRVEREEFVNAGVLLFSKARRFLGARIELDRERLLALDPAVDLREVEDHLAAIESVCRGGSETGPLAGMTQAQRFRWLVAPRSTIVQASPVHLGRCDDPDRVLADLVAKVVRRPA